MFDDHAVFYEKGEFFVYFIGGCAKTRSMAVSAKYDVKNLEFNKMPYLNFGHIHPVLF